MTIKHLSHLMRRGNYHANVEGHTVRLAKSVDTYGNAQWTAFVNNDLVFSGVRTKAQIIKKMDAHIDALLMAGTVVVPTVTTELSATDIDNAMLERARDYQTGNGYPPPLEDRHVKYFKRKDFLRNIQSIRVYDGRVDFTVQTTVGEYRYLCFDRATEYLTSSYLTLSAAQGVMSPDSVDKTEKYGGRNYCIEREVTKQGIKPMKFKDIPTQGEPTTPTPTPAAPQPTNAMGTSDELLRLIVQQAVEPLAKKEIKPIVEAELKESVESTIKELTEKFVKPTIIQLQDPVTKTVTDPQLTHKTFPNLLKAVRSGVNVMMVGPAGSGKTTAGEQLAQALDLPFYFSGALIEGKHEVNGFIDGNGHYWDTQLYKAYSEGGVYLQDEFDGSHASIPLTLNMAIENDKHDFPTGRVDKHKDFVLVAAANTYGRGADREYVGRNQLDSATLDRYVMMDWDYDETLERVLAQNDGWVDEVQRLRRGAQQAKVRHIISPRASINGAKLLAAGFKHAEVLDMVVFKGLAPEQVTKIKNAA